MIPNIELLTREITEINYPTNTYKIEIRFDPEKTLDEIDDRINGYTDDMDAIKQAIYLILSTERFKFIIYSWDYGVELVDLFGKPMPYVMSELPRRITEALTQDNRISGCKDFDFVRNGKKLLTTFTVTTTVGDIPSELEVEI